VVVEVLELRVIIKILEFIETNLTKVFWECSKHKHSSNVFYKLILGQLKYLNKKQFVIILNYEK